MIEIWRDIKGYDNKYQVSNFGIVKSLNYNNTKKEHILKLCDNGYGYLLVNLRINNKSKTHNVHRLVCEAFLPNPENKCTVNHKNGIKTDNRVENLEWSTYSENIKHAFEYGLKEVASIPIVRYSKTNEYIDEFKGVHDAFRLTGICYQNIHACCKGRLKSAGGYIWKYKQL